MNQFHFHAYTWFLTCAFTMHCASRCPRSRALTCNGGNIPKYVGCGDRLGWGAVFSAPRQQGLGLGTEAVPVLKALRGCDQKNWHFVPKAVGTCARKSKEGGSTQRGRRRVRKPTKGQAHVASKSQSIPTCQLAAAFRAFPRMPKHLLCRDNSIFARFG